MAGLQTFDQALPDSAAAGSHDWSDERFDVVGALASKLSGEELGLLRMIWPDRPLLWQTRCAEVLGSAQLDEAIEILMDMVGRANPDVALAVARVAAGVRSEAIHRRTNKAHPGCDSGHSRATGRTAAPGRTGGVPGDASLRRRGARMTSGRSTFQHSHRPLRAGEVGRRLGLTRPLQLLDSGPGIRALPHARLDEGLQLGLEELGDSGADGHRCEGRAFHDGYFEAGDVSGKCQGDVRRAVSIGCRGSD